MAHNIQFKFKKGKIIRSSDFFYIIDEELSQQGAQGISYIATQKNYEVSNTDVNAKVFVKIPRVDENLFGDEVRDLMQKLAMTLLAEFENKYRFRHVEHVAKILDLALDKQDDEEKELSVAIPCLIQQYVENGMPFTEYLKSKFCSSLTNAFQGIPNQKEWFQLARKLAEIVRDVHNRHIVHGDIWPNNILMQKTDGSTAKAQPWLIDFGQSFLVDQSYYKESNSDKTRPYWAPERKGGSWYTPADIYSIGGVLYYMATGRDPCLVGKGDEGLKQLKNYVQDSIFETNPTLFRENPGIARIIDKCLRHDPSDRYRHPESLLEMLYIFDYESAGDVRTDSNIEITMAQIKSKADKLNRDENPLFTSIVQGELRKLSRELDGMLRGHHEIFGAREELINNLLRYLSVLQPGDEYLTVTVPHYWTGNNLGVNGRFLTMNILMASRGIHIKRVFLLTEEDHKRPEVIEILEAHVRAEQAAAKSNPKAVFITYYVEVNEEDRRARVERAEHVAIWRRKTEVDEPVLSIGFTTTPLPDSSSDRTNEQISKIRFWSASSQKSILEEMDRRVQSGQPIAKFLAKLNL